MNKALANHYTESKQNPIDFQAFGEWCRSRNGQVIVCEQEGASWLPFKYLGRSSAARGNRKSCEALWLNRPLKQLSLFGEP